MADYETPGITELGSVADMTRASGIGFRRDGWFDWGDTPYPEEGS
jgi:hypothetical protein